MKWFIAKIVFQIRTGASDSNHQFDESLRMIQAADIADAYKKAYIIGKKEQISFANIKNEIIEWRFIEVPDVIEIDQLEDGVELYSQTAEAPHPDEFINALRSKAMMMRHIPI